MYSIKPPSQAPLNYSSTHSSLDGNLGVGVVDVAFRLVGTQEVKGVAVVRCEGNVVANTVHKVRL